METSRPSSSESAWESSSDSPGQSSSDSPRQGSPTTEWDTVMESFRQNATENLREEHSTLSKREEHSTLSKREQNSTLSKREDTSILSKIEEHSVESKREENSVESKREVNSVETKREKSAEGDSDIQKTLDRIVVGYSYMDLVEELRVALMNLESLRESFNIQVQQKDERIAELEPFEFLLRKRDCEIERLHDRISVQETRIVQLRDDLHNVTFALKDQELKLSFQKTQSEKVLTSHADANVGLRSQLKAEQALREKIKRQKKEAEHKFDTLKEENKQKAHVIERLDVQLFNMSACKTSAEKCALETENLMRKQVEEHKKEKKKLVDRELQLAQYMEQVDRLQVFRTTAAAFKKETESLRRELDKRGVKAETIESLERNMKVKVNALVAEAKENAETIEQLEAEVQRLEKVNSSRAVEIENLKKTAEEQLEAKLNLGCIIHKYKKQKVIQEKKEKHLIAQTKEKEQATLDLQALVNDIKRKARRQKLATKAVELKKTSINKKLSATRQQLLLEKRTIKKMTKRMLEQRNKLEEMETTMSSVNRENTSVTKNLAKAEKQVMECRQAIKANETSFDQQKMLNRKNSLLLKAERDGLQKELQRYKELTRQQQKQICLLKTDRDMQEKNLTDCTEALKITRVEMERFKTRYQNANVRIAHLHGTSRRDRVIHRHRYQVICERQRRHHMLHGGKAQQDDLEEKDEEIEVLKERGKQYAQMIKRFIDTDSQNRQLKGKLMASEGSLSRYKLEYSHLQEENKKLTQELKKVKLENAKLSRFPTLPPKTSVLPHVPKPTSQSQSLQAGCPLHPL